MSADAFNAAVRGILPGARIEAEGRVAILSLEAAIPMNASSRRRIVALAREHGFSNVALELTPDANLSGDHPSR